MRVFVFVLAACTSTPTPEEPTPDAAPPAVPTVTYLSPTDHLLRAAMTLVGRRPSPDELASVAADPAALDAIVDGYLASPEFGAVMRDLHAETLMTRVDLPARALPRRNAPASWTQAELGAAWEEPLNLIEHVIVTDRPYSEIVTADYAISDPVSALIWGMTNTGGGLEVASWLASPLPGNAPNGIRPHAGILSSSAVWARFQSAGANYHRGRANWISNALLCFDFLHSDIQLDTSIDLSDPQVVANAVRTSPACVGCHQTLDPLASTLFGFQYGARAATYPVPMYWTQYEGDWTATNERPPAFFGQPATTVRDVGALIAKDPRFPRCTASRFAAYFTQTDRRDLEFGWVSELTARFVASNLSAKVLAKTIVMSDEFRASHATADATAEQADALHGMLRARPEQLDTLFQDLTGVAWTTDSAVPLQGVPFGRSNLLRGDFLGFRALAGGIDSYFVTKPTFTYNAVGSMLLRTLAATAAGYVVDAELTDGSTRHLLTDVSSTEVDPTAIRAQLSKLHLRIWGAFDAPDSEAVDETYQLFVHALDGSDVPRAWKLTLTAMLSDLRVAFY